jgi:3-deoxy-D-manno-octulosonate 8-phosphate phosphatase KdsC-like HAD superfamily phosphatase
LTIDIFILSKETNSVVAARAKKLKIGFYQGIDNKMIFIENYLNIVNDKEWGKVCQNYKNLVMEFDQGNTYFVKLLDQLLSENRNQT